MLAAKRIVGFALEGNLGNELHADDEEVSCIQCFGVISAHTCTLRHNRFNVRLHLTDYCISISFLVLHSNNNLIYISQQKNITLFIFWKGQLFD